MLLSTECVLLSAALLQVFTQCVWALATLAPGRYGLLFESLARSYAAKVRRPAALTGSLGTNRALRLPFFSEQGLVGLPCFALIQAGLACPYQTSIDPDLDAGAASRAQPRLCGAFWHGGAADCAGRICCRGPGAA